MDENRTRPFPPHRAEARFVKAVKGVARQAYANPERTDCPSSEAIQAVVVRLFSHPDFDDTVDHVAMCAPCLEEYERRRQRYQFRRRCRWVAGIAALLILGVLLWRYFPTHHQRRNEQLAQGMLITPVVATLDYSAWSAERSASPLPRNPDTPHLLRARIALTLLLPIGTEDGSYTVQVQSASGDLVAQTSGVAVWTGTAEKLPVILDLSRFPAGPYVIGIQSASNSLRRYPFILE